MAETADDDHTKVVATDPNSERMVAIVTETHKNYVISTGMASYRGLSYLGLESSQNRTVVVKPEEIWAKQYFIRKTSMRDRGQWAALSLGDHVEFTLRWCAGRGVVVDAIRSKRAEVRAAKVRRATTASKEAQEQDKLELKDRAMSYRTQDGRWPEPPPEREITN